MSKFQLVILSYNHPEITLRCVKSALDFTQEIILVHNGSDEKNVHYLKFVFPEISHLEFKENTGFTGGANQGLKAAFLKSQWALFLTNDCTLESLPEIPLTQGVWGAHVLWKNSSKTDCIGGRFFPSKGHLAHCKSLQEFETMGGFAYIPGTAFVIDKESFEKAGPFDQSLGTFWEDVDLSMRATKGGVQLGVLSDFRVRHAGGKTTKKKPYYTKNLFPRNRKIISRKYCPNLIQRIKLEINFLREWRF